MKAMKNEFEIDFEELTGQLIKAAYVGDNLLIENLIKKLVPELNRNNSESKLNIASA
jgi:hypothetical protein